MKRSATTWALVLLSILCCTGTASAAGGPKPILFGVSDFPTPGIDVAQRNADLGATVWRYTMSWREVQPNGPGDANWSTLDQVHASAGAHGMRLVVVVRSTPAWAQPQDSGFGTDCYLNANRDTCQRPVDPSHLSDWTAFVKQLATRYPDLAGIEVANEPNLGAFNWQPDADPSYYAQVLEAAYAGVKASATGIPVVLGGLTVPPDPAPSGTVDPRTFLEGVYAAGARGSFDAIGLHTYAGRRDPSDQDGWPYLLRMAREVSAEHGDAHRPLWITETGYTTTGTIAVTEQQQADWLAEIVRQALQEPDVGAVIVHTLLDRTDTAANDPETGYGLLHADGTPKPAWASVQAAVRSVVEQRARAQGRLDHQVSRAARVAARRPAASRRRTSRSSSRSHLRRRA